MALKGTSIYYTLLLFLLSCKPTMVSNQKSDNDVYYKIFLELKSEDSCLNELYKEYLSRGFKLCSITTSEKEVYSKYPKVFLKGLASDFDNPTFLQVKNLKKFSVLSLRENQEYNDLCISIEEFDFATTQEALSVFTSLKDYQSKEIHFATINWIWLLQENSLYRVSSDNHTVTSVEMQSIKNHLKTLLERKDKVRTLTFL